MADHTEYTDAINETEDLFNPRNIDDNVYIESDSSIDIAQFVENDIFKDVIEPYTVRRADSTHAEIYDESSQKIASIVVDASKNFTIYEKSGTPAFEYDTTDDDLDTICKELGNLVNDVKELNEDSNDNEEEIVEFIPDGGQEVLEDAKSSLEKTLYKIDEMLNFNKTGLGKGATKEQSGEMLKEKLEYAAKLWKETKRKMDGILS